MKIKNPATFNKSGDLCFDDFYVKKESKNFYGVYKYDGSNELVTSGATFSAAAKKAKLLQIGYDIRKEEQESSSFWGNYASH